MSSVPQSDQPLNCETTSVFGPNAPPYLYRQIFENLFDGVYFVDTQRRIVYWNHGAEELTGYTSNEVLGTFCFDNILRHVDESGHPLCSGGCPLDQAMGDGQRHEAELYLCHKAGYRVPVSIRVTPIRDSMGSLLGAVEVFSDISPKKSIEKRVKDLETEAYTDSLTGLSNRRHIEMLLQHAIQEVDEFGTKTGLLVIDIDNFKAVNDQFGHNTGDAVLKIVAATLKHALRIQDQLGRWGGDEFIAILKDVEAEGLANIAERCRELVAASSVLAGCTPIYLTASIGGTLLQPGELFEAVFEKADSLLRRSKRCRNRATIE